jgi:HEAT repeat protein
MRRSTVKTGRNGLWTVPGILWLAAVLAALALPAAAAAAALPDKDPAETLYKQAREVLSEEDYARAADLYGELVEKYAGSSYAGDALYWKAFALYRMGGTDELRQAVQVLNRQQEDYPEAATQGDGLELSVRIHGELARRGDRESAQVVSFLASDGDLRVLSEEEWAASQKEWAEHQKEGSEQQRQLALSQVQLEEAQRVLERDGTRTRVRFPRASLDGRPIRIEELPEGEHGSDIRIEALNALVKMDPDRAIPAIRKVLARQDKENARLRREEVFIIARIKGAEADEMLMNAACNDTDLSVRADAVMMLSSVSSDKVIDTLEHLIRESDDLKIQENATVALYHHPSPRATVLLQSIAADAGLPREVRRQAITILGVLGEKRSLETAAFLMNLYREVSAEPFKEDIVVAIGRFRTAETRQWTIDLIRNDKEIPRVRQTALSMLMSDPQVSTHDLVEIYNTVPEKELRKTAIWLLSRKEDPEATRKLLEIAREETDPEIRLEAIRWVGETNAPEAAELLEKLIEQ